LEKGAILEARYYAGLDCGTTTTKAVIIDGRSKILGSDVRRSGANLLESADGALNEALASAGLGRKEVGLIVATGYGRRSVSFARES
jgi:activator of 2-hydroxyglutaryl-CoA dehydratase